MIVHLRGWEGFALAAERLPASAPIPVPQATAFWLHGKAEERIALLRTPVYAKGWRHRLLWSPLHAMSDDAFLRKQKSLRREYGMDPFLARDVGAASRMSVKKRA